MSEPLPAAILATLAQGIPIIGAYPSGAAIASGDDFAPAFTTEPETVLSLWNGEGDAAGRAKGQHIRLFRFQPARAGLVVFDLDRGHDGGGDGIASFYARLEREGAALPSWLATLEHFPAWTRSPRGGAHLFFKSRTKYRAGIPAPDVEILAGAKLATVPGSHKPAGEYLFHGDLAAAPQLPAFLARWLEPVDKPRPAPAIRYGEPAKGAGIARLETIMGWVQDEGAAGRNELAFKFALRAARSRYGYTAGDVRAFMEAHPATQDLPARELDTAIQSAFRRQNT